MDAKTSLYIAQGMSAEGDSIKRWYCSVVAEDGIKAHAQAKERIAKESGSAEVIVRIAPADFIISAGSMLVDLNRLRKELPDAAEDELKATILAPHIVDFWLDGTVTRSEVGSVEFANAICAFREIALSPTAANVAEYPDKAHAA